MIAFCRRRLHSQLPAFILKGYYNDFHCGSGGWIDKRGHPIQPETDDFVNANCLLTEDELSEYEYKEGIEPGQCPRRREAPPKKSDSSQSSSDSSQSSSD